MQKINTNLPYVSASTDILILHHDGPFKLQRLCGEERKCPVNVNFRLALTNGTGRFQPFHHMISPASCAIAFPPCVLIFTLQPTLSVFLIVSVFPPA